MSLFKISKGKACDKYKSFEILLGNYETTTTDYYVDKITRLDISITKTYSGGCFFFYHGILTKFNR